MTNDVLEISRLSELADEVRSEHDASRAAQAAALEHAIRAGHALLEARALIDPGTWTSWLINQCHISRKCATNYQRLAFYEDDVRATAASTITGALRAIEHLPAINGKAQEVGRNKNPRRLAAATLLRIGTDRQRLADAASLETDPSRKAAFWDAWGSLCDAQEILDEVVGQQSVAA
jgi:hypothetical protein